MLVVYGQTDQCKRTRCGRDLVLTAQLLVESVQSPASFKKIEKKEKENRDISILATGEKMKRSAP